MVPKVLYMCAMSDKRLMIKVIHFDGQLGRGEGDLLLNPPKLSSFAVAPREKIVN